MELKRKTTYFVPILYCWIT